MECSGAVMLAHDFDGFAVFDDDTLEAMDDGIKGVRESGPIVSGCCSGSVGICAEAGGFAGGCAVGTETHVAADDEIAGDLDGAGFRGSGIGGFVFFAREWGEAEEGN